LLLKDLEEAEKEQEEKSWIRENVSKKTEFRKTWDFFHLLFKIYNHKVTFLLIRWY